MIIACVFFEKLSGPDAEITIVCRKCWIGASKCYRRRGLKNYLIIGIDPMKYCFDVVITVDTFSKDTKTYVDFGMCF